jgi:phosphoglycolate phosphatase
MTFQLRSPDGQTCDGVIFDLDGTLWDSSAAISHVWSYEFRKAIPLSMIHSCMGLTAEAISQRLGVSLAQLTEVQSKENDYLWRWGGHVYPNVCSTLEKFRLRSIPCFIVSNCQAGYVECFIHRHEMEQFFKSWRTSATGSKAENIRSVLTAYDVTRALVVGDGLTDYEAAKANHLPMVQVKCGFGEPLPKVTRIPDIGALIAWIT